MKGSGRGIILGAIWKSSGETMETHEKPQVSRCPGGDLKPEPPEYEAGMLTSRHEVLFALWRLVPSDMADTPFNSSYKTSN
jgi:hypothetical protein